MTPNEKKRYEIASEFANGRGRTAGEIAAAEQMMAAIDAKINRRIKIANAYTTDVRSSTIDIKM